MKIVFAIGGTRSGKSSFALKEASKIKGEKAYIATSEALDDEMRERIARHKKDRGDDWDTFEEPKNILKVLSNVTERYSVVVLDCLTLWLSNVIIGTRNSESGTRNVEERIHDLIDSLQKAKKSSRNPEPGTRFFIVSNEVGMGIVPENEMARKFRDLAGFLNQQVAEIADEVYLVTAGIPIKIK